MRPSLLFFLVASLTSSVAFAEAPVQGKVGQIILPGLSRVLFAPVGESGFDLFGSSVAGAGDVNGDGYADVIVGATNVAIRSGRAYVYYGGPAADANPDLVLTGFQPGGRFGSCVAGAGDVNRDGYSDLIVGTAAADRAYLYLGGPYADAVPDLTLSSPEADDGLGRAVAGAGDVNGDGYDDFVVGAPYSGGVGRAYVHFGGPAPHDTPDLVLSGNRLFDEFGGAVASAGDVNGDGYTDVIIGAAAHYPPYQGRAYVYYGGREMDASPNLVLMGDGSHFYFGISVAGAGDANGDGYADVVVAAVSQVYVFHGGPAPNAVPDLVLGSSNLGHDVWYTVASGGDVNGDGYGDPMVGASDLGGDPGRVYVYFGGPQADATPDVTVTGDDGGMGLGDAIAGAGDVDGDGCSDLVVGLAWVGQAYVISTQPLLLRATVEISPSVLNPKSSAPWVTASIEPGGFDAADIDVPSVRLAGSVPALIKAATLGDGDADGVPDLTVKFSRAALDPLLHPGMNRLEVTGSLTTGERFRGADSVRVIGPGHGLPTFSVAPNPFNPSALLRVKTTKPGPVRVQLFDLGGRLVRTLMDLSQVPAGPHEVRIEADGGEGMGLGSGVYFLRIHTADGDQTGRIVLLK